MYIDCFFVLSFQDAKNILVAFDEEPGFWSVSRRSTWQYHNWDHQWMRFIRMNNRRSSSRSKICVCNDRELQKYVLSHSSRPNWQHHNAPRFILHYLLQNFSNKNERREYVTEIFALFNCKYINQTRIGVRFP